MIQLGRRTCIILSFLLASPRNFIVFEKKGCFIVIDFQLCFIVCIRRVRMNFGGLKLNGTHHLFVYSDDNKILGRRVHTVKKKKNKLS